MILYAVDVALLLFVLDDLVTTGAVQPPHLFIAVGLKACENHDTSTVGDDYSPRLVEIGDDVLELAPSGFDSFILWALAKRTSRSRERL